MGRHHRAAFCLLALAALLLAERPAAAQEVWVTDEVQLNLRTGPGNEFRITASLKTGDSMTVVQRGEGWTLVRLPDGREGWLPAGFLADEPPALVRVGRMEQEAGELQGTVEGLRQELETLRAERSKLEASETAERGRAQELETENLELKAGARWPEWITGAALLASGMLVGSLVQTWASRRPRHRIKL
jgi:SH3 domain protein